MKYIKEYKEYGVLYHGSSEIIEILEPYYSDILDDKAVFATNKRWLALCFIAKFKDSDIKIGLVNGIPYLEEVKKDAFDIFKTSGYIYTVSSEGFKSHKKLGLKGSEFIKKTETKIIETEKIDNVYMSLKNTDVYMVPYDIVNSIRK